MTLARTAVAALALIIGATACAATTDPTAFGAEPPPDVASMLDEMSTDSDQPDTDGAVTDAGAGTHDPVMAGEASKNDPQGTQNASQEFENTAPLTVTMSSQCLMRGDTLLVTATSLPRSGVGMAIGYSDPPEGGPKFIPDWTYFERNSNPTGTVRWSFVIRPTTPIGPALLKVLVSTPDGGGALEERRFQIAEHCA